MKKIVSYKSLCVSCPQGCINCGRDRDFPIYAYTCDDCDTECEPDEMRQYEDKELCMSCLIKNWLRDTPIDDVVGRLYANGFDKCLKDDYEEIKED